MQSEKAFEYAVQLASAFVASGAYKLPGGSMKPEHLGGLVELIDSLYTVVQQARRETPKADEE